MSETTSTFAFSRLSLRLSLAAMTVLTAVSTVLLSSGCDSAGGSRIDETGGVPIEPFTYDKTQLESLLKGIAETGVAGSAMAGVPESIEKMSLPAEQQEKLKQLADRLNNATNDRQVRSTAKQMLKELEGA